MGDTGKIGLDGVRGAREVKRRFQLKWWGNDRACKFLSLSYYSTLPLIVRTPSCYSTDITDHSSMQDTRHNEPRK